MRNKEERIDFEDDRELIEKRMLGMKGKNGRRKVGNVKEKWKREKWKEKEIKRGKKRRGGENEWGKKDNN